jgi:DNA-binding transcriptional regulator LsrR (DeoR family)
MTGREPEREGVVAKGTDGSHFPPALLYAAAQMYYEEDATQAEVALKLGTSRATVSRLLSEARRQGIVRIEVVRPQATNPDDVSARLAEALGLAEVYLSGPIPAATPAAAGRNLLGWLLAPAVARALAAASLAPGEILLVSSGRTIYEVALFDLVKLPGVIVAPTVGGTDQPEGWYQTNEITRMVAGKIEGRATYLFAPALPGPDLYETLQRDPAIQRVLHLWPKAKAVLTGIGAPPLLRDDMPAFVPRSFPALIDAVGDICSRFFDRSGHQVDLPGGERLIAVQLADLRKVPIVIAVASGREKIVPAIVGARAGYFNRLVTDPLTAQQILDSL